MDKIRQEAIEEKLAHQELTIDMLSSELINQQKEIHLLKVKLDFLEQKLLSSNALDSNTERQHQNEKPPHY